MERILCFNGTYINIKSLFFFEEFVRCLHQFFNDLDLDVWPFHLAEQANNKCIN